ncbi:MAG: hypothetical protein LBS19_15415 [Clostridiales bacterium]|jgi:hypothetical protein|nr:hypothetical protein [Clostridiales bacterium]
MNNQNNQQNYNTNDRFSQVQQGVFRLQKIETMLKTLDGERLALEEKARYAWNRLQKENRDYEKITRRSISAMFHQALGDLEARTEKERREALEAELQYNQIMSEIEDIRNQELALENERLQYAGAKDEYDRLYQEKRRALMGGNSASSQEMSELTRRLEESARNVREIDEAISVGNEAADCLEDALRSLQKASNWGVWDMLGGGLISGLAKHSNIDDASASARHAQSLLRRFRTELADVRISEDISVDIGGFAKFADFFFDGLIADWFMQSRINATRDNFSRALGQVEAVLGKLDTLRNIEIQSQDELNARVAALVSGS